MSSLAFAPALLSFLSFLVALLFAYCAADELVLRPRRWRPIGIYILIAAAFGAAAWALAAG